MRRRVLKVAAILLGLAALAAFAGSVAVEQRHVYRGFSYNAMAPWDVRVERGRLVAMRSHIASSFGSWPSDPSRRNGWGFSYECRRFSGGGLRGVVMAQHVAVPTYPLLILGVPLLAWGLYRPWNRYGPGLCPACGYDLRGTSGGACPECGEKG